MSIQSTPVIPSQCRNIGVGIRLSFVQFEQFGRVKVIWCR